MTGQEAGGGGGGGGSTFHLPTLRSSGVLPLLAKVLNPQRGKDWPVAWALQGGQEGAAAPKYCANEKSRSWRGWW